MSINDIQRASLEDPDLDQIRNCLQTHQLYNVPKPYKSIVDELYVTNQGILLRRNRIVLPIKLRKQAVYLAHEDHAGITKCKQRSDRNYGGLGWTNK